MILIALGSNLHSSLMGPPLLTLDWAMLRLQAAGLRLEARSRWYRSEPVPPSGQPWYINGIARFSEASSPTELMRELHAIEAAAGRHRAERNAARPLDLDLIDYQKRVSLPGAWPILPHPRLAERAFVLLPLAEVAPDWRHPLSGEGIDSLIAGLPAGQVCRPLQQSRPPL